MLLVAVEEAAIRLSLNLILLVRYHFPEYQNEEGIEAGSLINVLHVQVCNYNISKIIKVVVLIGYYLHAILK